MHQKFIHIILLIVLSFGIVHSVEAQNPKRTKVYKKKAKKIKKPSKEPVDYNPRGVRDTDGDGVPNYYDHCPNTPKGQTVTTFGCAPDRDRDGFADAIDPCPDEWGPKDNKGCPYSDRDNDGILDAEDVCPDTPGERRFLGCPDTDGDGIQDSKDNCPQEKGIPANQGCPQKLAANKDSDNDGIPDFRDKCVYTPGIPENKGCPEMKPEDKEAIKAAFENLLFETGKDIIKSSSYPSLRELANVLKKYPETSLKLEGHTDNQGDDDSNLDLSQRRADAVKNFLMNNGVPGNRITAKGYGETRPVDTNDTATGRTHNRRVEMKIDY